MLAAAVVVIAGASFFVAQKYGDNVASGDVVAEINGKPIYSSEANAQLTALLGGQNQTNFSALDDQAKKIVVKELAANKLILEQAYKKGVDNNKDIKQKIAEVQDRLVKEQFLLSMAREKVTAEDVKKRYEELSEELKGKKQYKVRHIVLKTEDEAKKVRRAAKKSSFEKVAKEKSIDQKTAATGGDLGYLLGGNMIEEFNDVVPGLSKNEISKPFKTQYGWHIVKLEDSRLAEAAPFDTIKGRVEKELLAEEVQKYVGELLENAEIEIAASKQEEDEQEQTN